MTEIDIMQFDELSTINSPQLTTDQFLKAFDEYVTISTSYHSIIAALSFIAQLMNAHAEEKINLTEAEHTTLVKSYDYLLELVDGYDD